MAQATEFPRDDRQYLAIVVHNFRESLQRELSRLDLENRDREVILHMFHGVSESSPRRLMRELHKIEPEVRLTVDPAIIGRGIARNLVAMALNEANYEGRERSVPFDFVLASRDYDGKFPWRSMYPFRDR